MHLDKLTKVGAAFAVVMAICMSLTAVPSASAYVATTGSVFLTNTGYENYTSCDWKFYVSEPGYVSLDDDYWNLTVYGVMVNNTGTAATGDWTVTVYIDDGATNTSKASTITVSKTATVYGNVSWSSADIAPYVVNNSATYYVKLANATSIVKDTYVSSIVVSDTALAGSMLAMIPLIVSIVVILLMITLVQSFSNLFGKTRRK